MTQGSDQKLEQAVLSMLSELDPEPDRDGLADTPRRVSKAMRFYCSGYGQDPRSVVGDALFEPETDEMVVVKDIEVYSMCEHHLVPFHGEAHVAYLPDGRVTGLSKLARLVDGFAHRPQLQERLTAQVADCLQERLDPLGVLVVVEAEHLCMSMRGVKKPGAITVTSAVRGLMQTNAATRSEAMSLLFGTG